MLAFARQGIGETEGLNCCSQECKRGPATIKPNSDIIVQEYMNKGVSWHSVCCVIHQTINEKRCHGPEKIMIFVSGWNIDSWMTVADYRKQGSSYPQVSASSLWSVRGMFGIVFPNMRSNPMQIKPAKFNSSLHPRHLIALVSFLDFSGFTGASSTFC